MTARGVHLDRALTSAFLGVSLTHCDTLRHHAAAMMAKNPARGTVARAAGSGRRRALGGLRPAGATRAISYRSGFEALFRMGDRPVRSHKAVRERLFKYGALGLACGSYGGETGAPGRKPWCGLRRVLPLKKAGRGGSEELRLAGIRVAQPYAETDAKTSRGLLCLFCT